MKFLACDLDGTLVITEECFIIEENINAVKKLRKNGHKFIISTGRDLHGLKEIIKNNPKLEFDYLVLCNGALVLDSNFNEIYKNTLSHDTVKSVYDNFYHEEDLAMYVTYNEDSSVFYRGTGLEFKDFLGSFKNKNNEDTVFSKEREYNLISIFSLSKNIINAENVKDGLIAHLGKDFGVFRNQAFVDIVAKDCSKGSAIKRILEIENWKTENLYAIGDSFNDISMFAITQNSFTFNHAEDGVKSVANHAVDFVHECIESILSN